MLFLIKLIVWRIISLLTVPLYLSEPYKIMCNSNTSFKFLKGGSILNKSLRSFYLFIAKNGQCKKKWSVVSVSDSELHIGLRAPLKLLRNLCSFRWLNLNCNLDNNLTPAGSWIANNDFSSFYGWAWQPDFSFA